MGRGTDQPGNSAQAGNRLPPVPQGGGGFSGAGVNLSSDETLVVDNTNGHISMDINNSATGEDRSVYALRDFDTKCFFVLKEGNNTISVATSGGSTVDFTVEGHIYYGTV